MKQNIQAIRLSSIAPPAVHGAIVRIRATASADSVPIAGLTRLNLNAIAHPCCLTRGKQAMRLIGASVHARAALASTPGTHLLAHA
jgi:hypothetical protein